MSMKKRSPDPKPLGTHRGFSLPPTGIQEISRKLERRKLDLGGSGLILYPPTYHGTSLCCLLLRGHQSSQCSFGVCKCRAFGDARIVRSGVLRSKGLLLRTALVQVRVGSRGCKVRNACPTGCGNKLNRDAFHASRMLISMRLWATLTKTLPRGEVPYPGMQGESSAVIS